MTPKIIELKQSPVILVELNEEREVDFWIKFGSPIIIDYPNKVIGKLSELKEQQFAECVPKEMYSHITNPDAIWYEVYFYSLLESEQVYTENPYGGECPPDIHDDENDDLGLTSALRRQQQGKWQEAQSRTIDPARTVVLLRREEP